MSLQNLGSFKEEWEYVNKANDSIVKELATFGSLLMQENPRLTIWVWEEVRQQ